MFHDSTVAVVVRTRPGAIPLTMITIRKSTQGLPFFLFEYGALLGGPSGYRSSAINSAAYTHCILELVSI